MPTYEYVCEKCGHEFEVFQSMKDAPFKVCPRELCARNRWGRGKVRRKLGTGAGLIFKGNGFYITDYRSESYKAAAQKESGAPAAPAPASGKKGDAAPAAAKTVDKSAAKGSDKPAKTGKHGD